ncbi:MAG TPA: hypothetical protein VJB14_07845 [Planctomycetota bacterium]|nr:hypothetical protein [Planctomycetota bacterium]
MRAGALSDPSVAALLKEEFVCAWEKKGATLAIRIKEDPGVTYKEGGNIMSYVCSPRGEVIHAIPGDRSPKSYKEQLEWARTIYQELAALDPREAVAQGRAAHRERRPDPDARSGLQEAHEFLSSHALSPIASLERHFFETLLRIPYAPDQEVVIREVNQSDVDQMLRDAPRG